MKIAILILLVLNQTIAQKTKLDTLNMFQGHWVFKSAINPYYSKNEIKEEIKKTKFGKIHIFPNRFYGNIYQNEYENYKIKPDSIKTEFGNDFYNIEYENIEKNSFLKEGIIHQSYTGVYYDYTIIPVPYYSFTFLEKQKMLMVFWDYTKIFLEKDKSEYLFCKVDSLNLNKNINEASLNQILKGEEVEVLERKNGWVKVRYWGKALLVGWVNEDKLSKKPMSKNYWEIYKNNVIEERIKLDRTIVYDKNYRPTKMYLIKGDIVEIIKESGSWLNIKYYGKKTIEGWIKKSDVE